MKTVFIILGCLVGAFVVFLIIYNRWAMKQSLLGAWVASTFDVSTVDDYEAIPDAGAPASAGGGAAPAPAAGGATVDPFA